MNGVLALSPTFDTVGWLTRSVALLREVGDVLLPPDPVPGGTDLVVVPELLALAEPDVRSAVETWVADQGLIVREGWPLGELTTWLRAFQTWQAWEAWAVRGGWLADRLDTLGADVRTRFRHAASVEKAEADAAYDVVCSVLGRPAARSGPPGGPRRHDATDLRGRSRRRARRLAAARHPRRAAVRRQPRRRSRPRPRAARPRRLAGLTVLHAEPAYQHAGSASQGSRTRTKWP